MEQDDAQTHLIPMREDAPDYTLGSNKCGNS